MRVRVLVLVHVRVCIAIKTKEKGATSHDFERDVYTGGVGGRKGKKEMIQLYFN